MSVCVTITRGHQTCFTKFKVDMTYMNCEGDPWYFIFHFCSESVSFIFVQKANQRRAKKYEELSKRLHRIEQLQIVADKLQLARNLSVSVGWYFSTFCALWCIILTTYGRIKVNFRIRKRLRHIRSKMVIQPEPLSTNGLLRERDDIIYNYNKCCYFIMKHWWGTQLRYITLCLSS